MSIDFCRELIKGRIAEVVFEQMLRDKGEFMVIPFGYEHTVPTLAQYQHLAQVKEVINNISDAPDFALVKNDKTEVFLVEVKYRKNLDKFEITEAANKLLKRWNPSWLFLATPDGFYFDSCNSILNKNNIKRMTEVWIPQEKQDEFLRLLNEFEK